MHIPDFWPAGPMASDSPIVGSFVASNGEEYVEVVVEPDSDTPGEPPSAAVAGPPKGRSKEGEKVRSAPRVETNYPAELLLNRKAQPGYKVLPGPKNQSIPTFGDNQLQLRLPPKKREFEEEGGDTCDTPNILASGSKGPGPPDPPPPASPIALPTKKKRSAEKN